MISWKKLSSIFSGRNDRYFPDEAIDILRTSLSLVFSGRTYYRDFLDESNVDVPDETNVDFPREAIVDFPGEANVDSSGEAIADFLDETVRGAILKVFSTTPEQLFHDYVDRRHLGTSLDNDFNISPENDSTSRQRR